nr:MAG: hypothetical protein [Bacteriophage sp.]
MHPFDEKTEKAVMVALQRYSEYQVARMYGLRVASVRLIRQTVMNREGSGYVSMTGRTKESPLQMGLRLHEDLARSNHFIYGGTTRGTIGPFKSMDNLPRQDYAGLEARVMAGFFTPNGVPTPALWGYLSQYVKKSGHAMLDILHDKEIYAPEQLERALDIDSQIEDMTQAQRIALLRRLSTAVYSDEFKDPTDSGSNVQDSE